MAVSKKKFVLSSVLILLLVGLAGVGYWWYREDHSPSKVVTVGTPKNYPIKKSTTLGSKAPAANNNASANSGGATDTQGNGVASNNSGTTSASGNITVYSPAPNSVLQSGDTISGTASVGTVQFRLNDNKVGVIAQGSLQVVNGKFSGILHFQPQGTAGRLDIFSTNSQGVEFNEVQIYVNF